MKLQQILNVQYSNVKKITQSLNKKEKPWFERYILPFLFEKYRSLAPEGGRDPQTDPFGDPVKKLNQIEKKCFEAMKTIKKNPKECYPVFQDLYHIVIHPKILLIAYNNLIQNNGGFHFALAKAKGFSLEKMIHLHETLKTNTYQPRSMVNSTLAPEGGYLGPVGGEAGTVDDRIVEESIRFVLEKIYEPMFQIYNSNFGFRNKMSPKNAWNKIKMNSGGNNYAIEGNIKGSLGLGQYKILIQQLERNIQDQKLIKLINKFLKAKILEEFSAPDWGWGPSARRSRTANPGPTVVFRRSQNNRIGRISPLLLNIYMKSFDEYIEKEIKQFIEIINKKQNRTSQGQYTKQTKEKLHELQENQKILKNLVPAFDWTPSNWKEINKQKKKILKIKNELQKIESKDKKTIYHKITYVRYADHWIMTICGTRSLTQLIKNKLETFLKTNLALPLSPDQMIITNLHKNWAYFLDFRLKVQKKEEQIKKIHPINTKKISDIIITIDIKRLRLRLRNFSFLHHKKPNKSMHQSSWTALSDYQIIQKYRKIIIEIFNDYQDIVTVDDELNWIYYIIRTSCAKTLAMKYKTRTINKIFKKYGSHLKVLHPNNQIQLQFPTLKELKELPTWRFGSRGAPRVPEGDQPSDTRNKKIKNYLKPYARKTLCLTSQ